MFYEVEVMTFAKILSIMYTVYPLHITLRISQTIKHCWCKKGAGKEPIFFAKNVKKLNNSAGNS